MSLAYFFFSRQKDGDGRGGRDAQMFMRQIKALHYKLREKFSFHGALGLWCHQVGKHFIFLRAFNYYFRTPKAPLGAPLLFPSIYLRQLLFHCHGRRPSSPWRQWVNFVRCSAVGACKHGEMVSRRPTRRTKATAVHNAVFLTLITLQKRREASKQASRCDPWRNRNTPFKVSASQIKLFFFICLLSTM